MLKVENLTKAYRHKIVFKDFNIVFNDNKTNIIIGVNGSGKTTLFRMIAGILEQDEGSITIDDEEIFENPEVKSKIFYLPDNIYFLDKSTLYDMMCFYDYYYNLFDVEKAKKYLKDFDFDMKQPIKTFSKGMKKQSFILLALSTNSQYLICDEVFDGLDAISRERFIKLINDEMTKRKFTTIFSSHNANELSNLNGDIFSIEKMKINNEEE